MVNPFRDAALLLLGHGSTLNADSSAPTYQHAEAIRERRIFAEVCVGFWKEEPNFRQALRQTGCRQVYVVPNFISSGYFTEQVIPRELGLSGPVTKIGQQEVYYCQPVGLHPSMTEALLHRAEGVVAASGDSMADPAKTACLFICGHGTSLNDNSTKIIHEQAAHIRSLGKYADCQGVLMEQKPYVKDWRILTDCPDVIVVPFFISDGLHSYEDIPVLLGLTHNVREKGFTNPHCESGRRLWYAAAIGTDSAMADVIIAQAEQFQAEHDPLASTSCEIPFNAQAELANFLQTHPAPWKIGQLAILPGGGGYCLMHEDDFSLPKPLRTLASLGELRELVRLDTQENFRPLNAAPNLRNGWAYEAGDLATLIEALDYIYPAALANWSLLQHDQLTPTPWKESAERQTGRFRIVRELDDAAVQDLVACHCEKGCLKQRLWSPAAQPLVFKDDEIPLLCPEACNYLIEKAREKLKGPAEE
jgi:sirohydrochlorin cobaltochelatase